MFCTKCGKEIKEGDTFCTNCGQKVEKNTKNTSPANTKNTKKITIFVIVIILVLMGIAAGVLYFYSNNEQENTNTINDENANIKDNENTNPKAETSKIEIGKKYECTSSGMVGYIQFTSETDFEMELGAIASENEIKKGTYKIQENIIILNITYDSNYDYLEYTENNEEFEPYTEEISIIKENQLAYTNQYNVTFIFVKDDEVQENPIATMKVKDYGTIKIELYPEKAPQTVSNFIALSNRGFYDGLKFHRIVKDFVIQGGDKNGDGTGSAMLSDLMENGADKEYCIKGEFYANGVNNDLTFEEGVIGMARSDYTAYSPSLQEQSYNSGSSQFFIMTSSNSALDGMYTAFGKVIEGLDIIHKIEDVQVEYNSQNGELSVPVIPIEIESIRVETNDIDYGLPETLEPINFSDLYQ